MPARISDAIRNAMLDRFDTDFPAGSIIEIREGNQPGAVTDPATGTVVATITLPSSPWAAASGGTKSKSNTWSDPSADATGTAGWFRLKNAADTLRFDGHVTATGGGGVMTLVTTSVTSGQPVELTSVSFTLSV